MLYVFLVKETGANFLNVNIQKHCETKKQFNTITTLKKQ